MCHPKTQLTTLCLLFALIFSTYTSHCQDRLIKQTDSIYTFDNTSLFQLIENDSLYKATMLLNETLLFAKKNNLKQLRAETCNGLGIVFSQMGNYKNARVYFNDCLKNIDPIKDLSIKNYALSNLANSYLLEKDFSKFDSIYPLTQKLSKRLQSILEFVNLENEIKKNYYQSNNDSLRRITQYALEKIKTTNFNTLSYPRNYPKTFKTNLEYSFKYFNAIARVKLKKYKAKGFDHLFSMNEDTLKKALGSDNEAYRKLATFNYYKYLYYNDVKKNLDSANKYLLKSDTYKYRALRSFENRNTKNGELLYEVVNAQDQLILANELHKKDLKISNAYFTVAVIALVSLLIAVILFFYYYKAKTTSEKINRQLQLSNKELQKIDKDRLEFFSILSHELRTPIYGITGLANLMEHESSETKKQTYLSSLISSSNYISVLIDNILQATKLRFQEKTLNLKPGKITDIVNNVTNTVKIAAQNKGLELITSIDESDDDEFILIDKIAFTQILINLIYNAIRYTKEGFVSINVSSQKRTHSHVQLLFEIKDSGIGIKEEHRDTVFNAFDNKLFLEKNSSGSGLGLHIVKTLLKSHNADINFTSQPNKGSNFYFTVDFKTCAKPEVIVPENRIEYIENYNVLIVDDNKINLLITKKNVERITGYTCETATNGQEAIELIQQKLYDLILLDINMPEIDGYEVSRHIRSLKIDTPIIALTALNSNEVLAKVEACGMNQVITKPYNFDDFKKTILSYSKKIEVLA